MTRTLVKLSCLAALLFSARLASATVVPPGGPRPVAKAVRAALKKDMVKNFKSFMRETKQEKVPRASYKASDFQKAEGGLIVFNGRVDGLHTIMSPPDPQGHQSFSNRMTFFTGRVIATPKQGGGFTLHVEWKPQPLPMGALEPSSPQ